MQVASRTVRLGEHFITSHINVFRLNCRAQIWPQQSQIKATLNNSLGYFADGK